MSSAMLIKQIDAIHIITDAVAYDKDGVVLAMGPKSFAIPHLSAAVAARGDLAALPLVGILANATDFVSGARNVIGAAEKGGLSLQLFVGGFLPAGAPYAFVASTSVAYTVDVDGFAGAPMPPASDPIYELIGRNADQIDPQIDGLALIEAQRRHPVDGIFIVGGWATLISIYRDRIEERILMRWPDRVGEKINPLDKTQNA